MLDILCNMLEFFFTLFFCCSLLDKKIKLNRYMAFLIIYIMPDILHNLFHIYFSNDADFIFSILMWIIFIKLYFKINLISSLSVLASSYIITVAVQFTFVVINSYIIHLNPENTLPVIGSIYTLFMSVLIYRLINLSRLFYFLFENGKIGKFIIVNIYALVVIIRFYSYAKLTTYYEHLLYIVVAFTTLIISNMLLSNQLKKIKHQEAQLQSYKEYLPVLDDLIQTVRIRQHNYNNQLQTIAGLIYTHNDYESLTTALKEQLQLATHSDIPEFLMKLNMPVVAGFLYQKSNEARKIKKTISYTFTSYKLKSNVPEYVMIEMFGILIDNAIEAVPEGSTIQVSIISHDEHITFTTRNAGYILTQDERKKFFSKGYTSKLLNKQHSGLGLYRLNVLLNKYHAGNAVLWNDGTDILFEIQI